MKSNHSSNTYVYEGQEYMAVDVKDEKRYVRLILRDLIGNYLVISELKTKKEKDDKPRIQAGQRVERRVFTNN